MEEAEVTVEEAENLIRNKFKDIMSKYDSDLYFFLRQRGVKFITPEAIRGLAVSLSLKYYGFNSFTLKLVSSILEKTKARCYYSLVVLFHKLGNFKILTVFRETRTRFREYRYSVSPDTWLYWESKLKEEL